MNSYNMSKNWVSIAEEIFSEVKQSSTSLDSLAKRISLYRYKIEQSDLIDVLLQEKNNILQEIQLEMNIRKLENNGRGGNKA